MRKVYICIMIDLLRTKQFNDLLESIDENQIDIHVFYHKSNEKPIFNHFIAHSGILDKKSDTSYCFLTNYSDWIIDIYIDTNDFFDAYIYYNSDWEGEGKEFVSFAYDLSNKLYFTSPQNIFESDIQVAKDARIYTFNIDLLYSYLNNSDRQNINQIYLIEKTRLEKLSNILKEEDENEKKHLKNYFIEKISKSTDYVKIFIYSFILQNWNDKDYVSKIIELAYESNEFTVENKWFIYSQMNAWLFVEPNYEDKNIEYLMYLLYSSIYQAYKDELENELVYIIKENRINERVLLITGQFLGLEHAPTKVMLRYCRMLQSRMEKDVVAINAAELLSSSGLMPFARTVFGNYIQDYNNVAVINHEDMQLDFFQCSQNMPNINEMRNIISFVKNTKPYYVLSIGPTLTADLCSNILPVITIATVPSKVIITKGQFLQINRKLLEDDIKFLHKCGKNEDYIITSAPVSAALSTKQKFHYTRKELNLPEDKFILTVVGNRLNQEIKADFVKMLNGLYKYNIFVAFIGIFDVGYKEYCDKYPEYKGKTINLGYQEDLLACYECCDLYVNPKRTGAAGTFTLAMRMGVPSLTIDFGDASVFTQEEFVFSDYNEMEKEIIRYATDSEYYRIQSEISKKIVESYVDIEKAFKSNIEKAINNEMFI